VTALAAAPPAAALRRRERFAVAALVAAVAAAYAPTLWNGLVWDDLLAVAGAGGAAPVAAASGAPGLYYRPAVFLSLRADQMLWAAAPFGYHLTNLLLHVANLLLLVHVARRSGASAAAALLGAAVFGLHPLQTDAVAYVSGRTDLLMTGGALLSWAALVGSGPAFARGLVAAAAGAVALLSKESGFALLLLWAWLAWRHGRDGRTRLALLGPGAVTALAVVVLRPASWPRFDVATTLPRLAAVGQAALLYLRLLIWPTGLQVDRLMRLPTAAPALAAGGLALVALLGLAVRGLARRGTASDWAVWTGAFYLPVANLVALYPDIADRALFTPEHNLYAPLAGLGVLAGLALERARARSSAAGRRALLAATLVVLAIWAVLTAERCTVWHDQERLFANAVAAGSASPRVWYNYGNALLRRGAVVEAATAFEGAAARGPNDAAVWANLGVARQRQGDYDAAERAYRQAAALAPDDAQIQENLGTLYLARGELEAARAAFTTALRLDPQRGTARHALQAMGSDAGQR
jgi:protein O-mannosyl-transferase